MQSSYRMKYVNSLKPILLMNGLPFVTKFVEQSCPFLLILRKALVVFLQKKKLTLSRLHLVHSTRLCVN